MYITPSLSIPSYSSRINNDPVNNDFPKSVRFLSRTRVDNPAPDY